jgi:hypothetical protein
MGGLLAIAALAVLTAGDGLVVRASEPTRPCALAAARAFAQAGLGVVVVRAGAPEQPGEADVLVGTDVELTRAVESGLALDGTELDLARIPWALVLRGGNPYGLHALADLDRAPEVWLPAGLAAHAARRALAGLPQGRVREAADPAALLAAPIAVLPLSLAGEGERVSLDLPPLLAGAAAGANARRPEAARVFLRYLDGQAGRAAFAGCGSGP